MSLQLESVAVWGAIALYALSSVTFIGGLAFARARALAWGVRLAVAGAGVHSAAIVARWVAVGHGPYLGFYEVAGLLAWVTVAVFLVAHLRYPGLSVFGGLVMPVALLVLGASLLADRAAQPMLGSLASTWLVIHVLFANASFGCYAGGFLVSAGYLLGRSPARVRLAPLLAKLPSAEDLDALSVRFVSAGFMFQGVMIATGAIWANEAWGRYWGWDPIETWSLVAWAMYALWLHVRITLRWCEDRTAWLAVLAFPVIMFSLLGVPVVYDSIHGAYLRLGPNLR